MLIFLFLFFILSSSPTNASILINEVHPNPIEGKEWIELFLVAEDQENLLEGYSLSDSYRQIYQFTTENFDENNFLVVEVSGLNNDQDQVILKKQNLNIVDQMSYQKSEKGMSWNRINLEENLFELGPSSKNTINIPSSPSPTISSTPSPQPSSTPQQEKKTKEEKSPSPTKNNFVYPEYDPQKIKLKSKENPYKDRKTRLVFLQEKQDKKHVINAIMGGSVISISAYAIIYVKNKKN